MAKTNVVQIHMLIIEETIYFNCNTFNEVTKYHKRLELDLQDGYIRVPSKIMADNAIMCK